MRMGSSDTDECILWIGGGNSYSPGRRLSLKTMMNEVSATLLGAIDLDIDVDCNEEAV